jgi:hypothetical protein
MNKLLPYNLKDTPEAIFRTVSRNNIEKHLLDTVLESASYGTPLAKQTKRQLAWRPDLIADLVSSDFLSSADRDDMVRTPGQALNVVAQDPALLPFWAESILSNAETAEQLYFLQFVQSRPVEIDIDAILQSVDGHPARKLRILAKHDPAQFHSYRAQVPAMAEAQKYSSPAWALEWLSRNPVLSDQPLDPELASTLAQDEGSACLAIRILRDRLADPIVWAALEGAIRSPRWIYQSLVSGLLIKETVRAETALHSFPAWMVEWLVDTHASIENITSAYFAAAAAAGEHELIGDLHHWFRTVSVARSLRRGSFV